jgi:hypothetical protein
MRVIVNGEAREIASERVDALLAELEYEGTHFAIASFGERQPAVFGRIFVPSARIKDQKLSPVRPRAVSRRSDTVTMLAPEARIASCMIAGDG